MSPTARPRRTSSSARDRAAEASSPWDVSPVVLPAVEVLRGTVATTALLDEDDVDALVLPVAPAGEDDEGVQPRSGVADATVRYAIDLAELADRQKHSGASGDAQTIDLPRPVAGGDPLPWSGLPSRIVLVGIGAAEPDDMRRAGAAVARATRGLRRVVSTVGADAGPAATTAFVEGYVLAAYRHPAVRTGTPEPGPAERLVLLGRFVEEAVDRGLQHARATWVARVLAATPSSTKSPAWFAAQARALAEGTGVTVEVLEADELEARGFGGILAVGGGSARPPCLVVARWNPADPSGVPPRHAVVVGKGITYDTGGLSIKPREAMVPMKTDVTGAAVALAAVLGAAAAEVPHAVTAVLPLAENAVGASSYRPGDVLRTFGGTTVEIANTDAEGRLVLADALAWADATLDPDVLVDVATLTGAAALGLSRHVGALYSPDTELAEALGAAGQEVGEPMWRMPLVADYRSAVDSAVADVRHVPADPAETGAGSITAALFLERFVGSRLWAHLDIAGPARSGSARHEVPEGATGFGARTLLRWLTRLP